MEKTTRSVIFSKISIWLILIVVAVMVYYSIFAMGYSLISPYKPTEARGVIVTLVRSTNRSIHLTINMIHSVMKFHSISPNSSYPFLIFHDQNFTSSMRQQMLSCLLHNYKQINISFALVDLQTSVQPANGSKLAKTMSYRLMCRFWTYDLFYHPVVVQGRYDYLMRMDDDSYFADATNKDLFLYAARKRLDYIYRAVYSEPNASMKALREAFFNNEPVLTECIYNNFFVIRPKWFYESERVQSFVRQLVRDDLILREYIGGGCAHAAMLQIDNQVKSKHVSDFSYGHNYHILLLGNLGGVFRIALDFCAEIKNSCQQLTVLRGFKGVLKRINLS